MNCRRLQNFYLQVGEPELWWIEEFVRKKEMIYIAEDNNEIIGFVLAEKLSVAGAILHLIAVKKEYQHKGVGSLLLKRVEEECRKRNLDAIILYGYAKNKNTLKFFEKHNYKKGSLCYEFLKFL